MRIARVGLTGGIAEGKSTVLGFLRDLGLRTASADAAARIVFEKAETQEAIAEILGTHGPVDRSILRRRMTESPDLRRRINSLMHRPILKALQSEDAEVVEVPLLVEACLFECFEEIWVVSCGRVLQTQRLTERLGSRAEALEMMRTQLPTRAKIPFADVVVRTDQPLGDVQDCIRLLMSERLAD